MSKLSDSFNGIKKTIEETYTNLSNYVKSKQSKKHKLNEIETKLDVRSESCLDWLSKNSDGDVHRADFDTLFLSGYSMLRGSKKLERLTFYLFFITLILLACTIITIGMAYYEIPEYPIKGQSVTPISSQTYIDRGTDLVHETEYLVKISKFRGTDVINIELLTNVKGFYQIFDTRGHNFDSYVNSSNKTIEISNIGEINPVLLRIIYVERSLSPELPSIVVQPLPPNNNESFYLFIRNTEYDIKYAQKNYNIVKNANLFLNTTMYDSWKNQSFIVYENDVPLYVGTINQEGETTIDIRALKEGESKTYFVKKY